MTYNNANELTQVANSTQGTAVAFAYDDWGRTVSQTVGSRSATYAYKYGSKLASVTSTLFGEGDVAFEYGGDQKRRSMTTGGGTTGYNWDMGWNVINEETSAGALARSYTHNMEQAGRATLGHVDGTSPATGAYRYYLHDHLGSTRSVINDEKDLLAQYAYTPYGDLLASTNPDTTTHLFTGHDWSASSGLYFAPFRYYSPETTRWLTRDPLGMVDGPNLSLYVGSDPINGSDPIGLYDSTLFKMARDTPLRFMRTYDEPCIDKRLWKALKAGVQKAVNGHFKQYLEHKKKKDKAEQEGNCNRVIYYEKEMQKFMNHIKELNKLYVEFMEKTTISNWC